MWKFALLVFMYLMLICADRIMQKQLSYMLGRQQIFLELNDDMEESDELTEIMSNAPLNGAFLSLAREVRMGKFGLRNSNKNFEFVILVLAGGRVLAVMKVEKTVEVYAL